MLANNYGYCIAIQVPLDKRHDYEQPNGRRNRPLSLQLRVHCLDELVVAMK